MAKATFGTVTEVMEYRDIKKVMDEQDSTKIKELIPGPMKTRLKLSLKNTLGKEKEIWVEAGSEVADFYAPESGLQE